MNPKRWIAVAAGIAMVLVALILAIVLRPKTEDTNVVGLCYREKATQTTLETLLQEKGLQVIVVDADGDQAKQLQQIGQMKEKGCDSLIVEPVMLDAADDLLQAIQNSGLPAVLIHRELDTALLSSYSQIAYIGTESAIRGTIQAQMMLSLPDGGDLNGDGVVSYMLLQGPRDHADTVATISALETALAAGSLETECLTSVWGDWTKESGQTLTSQEIAAFGKDIEVIFCGNDQMALGAIEAIADGGRTVGKNIYLYGMNGDSEAKAAVETGTLSGTVYADMTDYETAVVETVLNQIQQKPYEKIRIIPYIPVTKP